MSYSKNNAAESNYFYPSSTFQQEANLSERDYREMVALSQSSPEKFWEEAAKNLVWHTEWKKILEWREPFARWFPGGKLNASVNCLDRHVGNWRKNKAAIIWEGENGETKTLTYLALQQKVIKFAAVLENNGILKGDRVAIYMPQIPEVVVAMLACARIGAIHSVIFAGFSAESIKGRVQDARCKAIITADVGYRKGVTLNLKASVDEALAGDCCPSIKCVIVYQRETESPMRTGNRDLIWQEEEKKISSQDLKKRPDAFNSEHPLFILYTSGTTGKPKGIVHSTGGYLTQVCATTSWVFDLKDEDIYWCTADTGWVTGHSYIVYGPLANGATVFLYEGAPTHPHPGRFWEMIDRHKITIFYTAPTAIRTFMRLGEKHINKFDLSSLRLLGTVGEPINPEVWRWFFDTIGQKRCPIVDTWWQTETGAIMLAPLPATVPVKPSSATLPIPGLSFDIVDKNGDKCENGTSGFLVIKRPWPSMAIGIWGDEKRFIETYWSQVKGCYFTGDGAYRDEDDYYWIMGRIDDVVNVSGHRLGTAEVESAFVSHPHVAEAAVVSRPDDITGEAIVAFVTPMEGSKGDSALRKELMEHVKQAIGSFAKPSEIHFSDALPKTRSGKIMRRLLREIARKGQVKGDISTLEDQSIIGALIEDFAS